MTNITEFSIWENGIYQLETEDPALGGAPAIVDGKPVAGHANAQAKQLANRTTYLKTTHETFVSDLADNTDLAKGAELIGYQGGTVADKLGEIVAGAVTPPFVGAAIDVHNHSGVAHPELSAFITSEADRAENAADAAQASGDIYVDTTAGLAATTNGQYFSVPSVDSNEYLILYKNNAGVALEVKRYPSSDAVVAIDGRLSIAESTLAPVADAVQPQFTLSEEYLWSVVDSLNKIGLGLRPDGTLYAKFRDIQFQGGDIDAGFSTVGGDMFALVDSDGRIALRVKADGTLEAKVVPLEVIEARGTRSTLDQRISQSLTEYGLPIHHVWGEWFLRETRQRLRLRALGEATQLVVASIGDSWTHNNGRWTRPTSSTLKTAYGDAGAGYVSFARSGTTLPNGNIDSTTAVTYTGTWDTSAYYTQYSPDLGGATSSVVSDRLSYTIPATPSVVKLYTKGGAGVVRYRFNAGSWVQIDLSSLAVSLHVIDLPSPVAGVFDIEVVSGSPVLFGIDVQKADSGVRWHKLGATGSRASHWTAVDATQWQTSLQQLAPHLVTILLATNDQASYDPIVFKGHMQTLISRVKTALPLADILLIAPCENGRVNTWPMVDYASVLHELCATNRCAFLDLQYVFGDNFSEYASTSPRAWFNADLIHPEPATGGRAIADAALRLLNNL